MAPVVQKLFKTLLVILIYQFLIACTSMQHIDENRIIDTSDPWESMNRSVYDFNDALDRNILKHVSTGYVNITPDPFRIGVTNFFDNLRYLNVILNNTLQGKIDQSTSDIFRFVFNSTLGIGGLFDVATPMGLEAHDEDVGQTLAVWGSPQGHYVNIPALGPNTVRNLPDYVSTYFLDPFTYWFSFTVAAPVKVLEIVNTRANLLDTSKLVDNAAIDPYSFTREAYLQARKDKIYDGNPPSDDFDDLFDDLEFEDESFQPSVTLSN